VARINRRMIQKKILKLGKMQEEKGMKDDDMVG